MKLSKTKWTWRWYILSTKWFGIKVHWIRPTEDEWHTHPWNGFSLILGSYEEQLRPTYVHTAKATLSGFKPTTTIRNLPGAWKRVWFFNRIGAEKPHRTRGNVLTLFFHGPRVNEDWYWGNKKAPWRGVQNEETQS